MGYSLEFGGSIRVMGTTEASSCTTGSCGRVATSITLNRPGARKTGGDALCGHILKQSVIELSRELDGEACFDRKPRGGRQLLSTFWS